MKKNSLSFLIADDDRDDQELLTDALYSIDHNIIIATVDNGEQLLDFLTGQGTYRQSKPALPDAIIVDVNMPLLNGIEACRRIRMLDRMRSIPVFILTTSNDAELKQRCEKADASKMYTKPCEVNSLKSIAEDMYRATLEKGKTTTLAVTY